MTRSQYSTTDLNQLQSELTAWRRRQRGRVPLPEAVWRSAALLARSMGVSQVSRRLRLDYYKLNRWTQEATAGSTGVSQRPSFVELTLCGPSGYEGHDGYRAELGDGTAQKLILQLGRDLSAVVAVAEAFWRRER